MSPAIRRQLATAYSRMLRMSTAAEKRALDKQPKFDEMMNFARMQILSQELSHALQEDSNKVTDSDIEDYYKKNAGNYEQATFARIFVPRTKQAEAEAKEQDEKDEKAGDEAQKAKEAEEKAKTEAAEQEMTKMAETLRARAAAGEDFLKLD